MKKLISAILSFTFIFSSFSLLTATAQSKENAAANDSVTIFIDGIMAENIVDAETGERIYPPKAMNIVKKALVNAPKFLWYIATGKGEKAAEAAGQIVEAAFGGIMCDENGNIPSSTRFDYTLPTKEDIKDYLQNASPAKMLRFAFDWRLDIKTSAQQLHSFIEYVLEHTGKTGVNIVALSMGTCVFASYLKMYNYEYIDGAVFLVGGLNGATCCGEPFCSDVNTDADILVTYVNAMVGNGAGGKFLKGLLKILNKTGVLKAVCKMTNKVNDKYGEFLFDRIFSSVFAKLPGMWAMVPLEMYDRAKQTNGKGMSDTVREASDWYHYEVQAHTAEIVQGCFDRGIKTGIVAKYGYPCIPVLKSALNMTDGVIDTKYESFGATVAPFGSTLGDGYVQKVDNGHNCISPDGIIDSSTGTFCEYTWFIKNSIHADDYEETAPLFNFIFSSDKQVTCFDGDYSQYLIIEDGVLTALTAENDYNNY
ncbi:MAG: hypothetical protein K6B52_01965 [Clostridiales bacterium]|nr:hypothetical protein [Clostridiales bacterium]